MVSHFIIGSTFTLSAIGWEEQQYQKMALRQNNGMVLFTLPDHKLKLSTYIFLVNKLSTVKNTFWIPFPPSYSPMFTLLSCFILLRQLRRANTFLCATWFSYLVFKLRFLYLDSMWKIFFQFIIVASRDILFIFYITVPAICLSICIIIFFLQQTKRTIRNTILDLQISV